MDNTGREYNKICNQCSKGYFTNDHPERSKYCSSKCFYLSYSGENHHNWKGEEVGIAALHKWAKRRLIKPLACQDCGKITQLLDLANISQEYKRELSDWEYLCRLCHQKKDGRWLKFRSSRKYFKEEELHG